MKISLLVPHLKNFRIGRFMEKKTSVYQEFCHPMFVKYYL